MLMPPLGVSVGPSSVQHPGSYHPSVVITSSASSHHHPSVVQVHHALPTPPPQPPISHHQSSGSHHPSSTLASLQHNHLSPGHLLNEIHEAKRPRLMSLSNNASGSFAAALAAASGTNLMSGSGLPHHGTASHFSDQSARGAHLNQELHVDTRENTDSKKVSRKICQFIILTGFCISFFLFRSKSSICLNLKPSLRHQLMNRAFHCSLRRMKF